MIEKIDNLEIKTRRMLIIKHYILNMITTVEKTNDNVNCNSHLTYKTVSNLRIIILYVFSIEFILTEEAQALQFMRRQRSYFSPD